MSTPSLPQTYQSVTISLIIRGAAEAIEFYKKAFGVVDQDVYLGEDGKLMHAELSFGQTVFTLCDEYPEWGLAIQTIGSSPAAFRLNVATAAEVDAIFNRAIAAGAQSIRPVEDQVYGKRIGTLADPYGFHWSISAEIENVSEEEIRRRMQAQQ